MSSALWLSEVGTPIHKDMMECIHYVQVDSTHYPNWTGLISQLNSKGIKTLTYINPLLSNVSQRRTPYQHNYFEEALESGYVVKKQDGTVWTGYSNSTLVDLSNPTAYQWMVNIIIKVGYHGTISTEFSWFTGSLCFLCSPSLHCTLTLFLSFPLPLPILTLSSLFLLLTLLLCSHT